MSILITGGSGLIGASPAQMIVERGESPVLFDIAPIHPVLRRIESKIPGDRLTFKPDPASMELVKEIGTLRFNDERAQSEWEWRTSYSLPEMVDDFIEEFNQNHSVYL
jgi:nucleoside-diphosphate-sugar epimerase